MMGSRLSLDVLRRFATEQSLGLLGVTTNVSFRAEHSTRLKVWQESGHAAELKYMLRDSELFASPLALLPEAQSVLMFTFDYSAEALPKPSSPAGRVARYAWGRDYHKVLKRRLKAFCERVSEHLGREIKYRAFSDAVPFLERAFAEETGLGFVGKNSMLIQPGRGSFFFLGEILWDVEVENALSQGIEGGCGSCRQCRDACPTGAIVADRVVDAGLCISYLSIEKRGPLEVEERRKLGGWIFGCDVCQDVCPFNHAPLKTMRPVTVEEFSSEHGVGPWLGLEEILSIRDARTFESRFAGTALMRAKREGLIRNACCVARNQGVESLLPILEKVSAEDSSEIVRATAVWAGGEIRRETGCDLLPLRDQWRMAREAERSELVRREYDQLLA